MANHIVQLDLYAARRARPVRRAPTPQIREAGLAEMAQKIGRAAKDLRADPEMGNLIFFKTLLAGRIEMYLIGEAKSRARKAGDQAAYQAQVQAMREFADRLDMVIKEFPFTQDGFGSMLVEQLQIARDRARELNNINVDLVLQTLTPKVVDRIEAEDRARIAAFKQKMARSGISTFGGKVRILDNLHHDCLVTTRSYRKGAAGELKRVIIEKRVSIHKILSMFEDVLKGERDEEADNNKFIADLQAIGRDLPANKDRLRSAYLGGEDRDKPRDFRDYGKTKARIEIWGALKLIEIDTPQARGLACSLLSLAIEDYQRRNEAVAAMRELFTGVKCQTEILIGQVILSFVKYWAGRLFKSTKLDPLEAKKINAGLGKYLGTLFSDEVREPWFKQCRGRVTGALQVLSRFRREGGDERQVTLDMTRQILGVEFDFGARAIEFKNPAQRKLAWLAFLKAKAGTFGPEIIPQEKPSPQTELGF